VTLEDFLLTFYWGQKVGGIVWDEKEQINFGKISMKSLAVLEITPEG
jgi:hypothetical protein